MYAGTLDILRDPSLPFVLSFLHFCLSSPQTKRTPQFFPLSRKVIKSSTTKERETNIFFFSLQAYRAFVFLITEPKRSPEIRRLGQQWLIRRTQEEATEHEERKDEEARVNEAGILI